MTLCGNFTFSWTLVNGTKRFVQLYAEDPPKRALNTNGVIKIGNCQAAMNYIADLLFFSAFAELLFTYGRFLFCLNCVARYKFNVCMYNICMYVSLKRFKNS